MTKTKQKNGKAYGYLRMSTDEQIESSEFRQIKRGETYAERRGYDYDTNLSFADLGISGRFGYNLSHGNLAKLVEACEDKAISEGSVIIIEALDRLGRALPFETLQDVFLKIVTNGIKIHVIKEWREEHRDFSAVKIIDEKIQTDIGQFITVYLELCAAYQYSQDLSERLKSTFEVQRQKQIEQGIKVQHKCPHWLTWNDDKKEYEANEHADLIKRIYDEFVAGKSIYQLCADFDEEGIRQQPQPLKKNGRFVLDSKGNKQMHAAKFTMGAIYHYIEAKEVIGEHKLSTSPKVQLKDGRVIQDRKVQHVIKDYYPAIIDEDVFYKAQAIRNSRKQKGRKQKELRNIFYEQLICGYCQQRHKPSQMWLRATSKNKEGNWSYCFKCSEGLTNLNRCIGVSIRRLDLNDTVLSFLKEMPFANLLGDSEKLLEDIENEIATVQNELEGTKADIENLYDLLQTKGRNARIEKRLVKLEADEEKQADAIKSLEVKRAGARRSGKQTLDAEKELKKLVETYDDDLEQRTRCANLIHDIVESVECFAVGFTPHGYKKAQGEVYGYLKATKLERNDLKKQKAYKLTLKSGICRLLIPYYRNPKQGLSIELDGGSYVKGGSLYFNDDEAMLADEFFQMSIARAIDHLPPGDRAQVLKDIG